MRIVKPKTYKTDIVNLAKYIKRKKPSIDIHLLGCTEDKILDKCSFCTTADSTSWLSGVRYGYINDGIKQGHVGSFKKQIVNKRKEEVRRFLSKYRKEIEENVLLTATNASLCATICKTKYSKLVGGQD